MDVYPKPLLYPEPTISTKAINSRIKMYAYAKKRWLETQRRVWVWACRREEQRRAGQASQAGFTSRRCQFAAQRGVLCWGSQVGFRLRCDERLNWRGPQCHILAEADAPEAWAGQHSARGVHAPAGAAPHRPGQGTRPHARRRIVSPEGSEAGESQRAREVRQLPRCRGGGSRASWQQVAAAFNQVTESAGTEQDRGTASSRQS